MESLSQHESKARGLLRIVTSLRFIEHGTQKFFHFPPTDMEMTLGVNNGGDAAIRYCFVFLFFVFAGAGAWSVDASRGKA